MKTISGTLSAYLAGSTGIEARILFWISPKDRTTGATVNFGFWGGDDDMDFTINAVSRTYHGAGALFAPDPLTYQVGLSVNTYGLTVSSLAPEIQDALRAYDPRVAPVEIHRAFFDTQSGALLEEPMRMFKGQVDDILFDTPEIGGGASATINMSSSAIFLTRALSQLKSETMQRDRSNDRFFRWVDVSGNVSVSWGSA